MFEAKKINSSEILLCGMFDATKVEQASKVFDEIKESCVINCAELNYISSAGLGILLTAQKRLSHSGAELKLTNMNQRIREVFQYAGFDTLFEIE